MTSSRVAEFVKRYVREQDYYARVAELCGRRLERALRDGSIRAITTWRAKRPDRLQAKLEARERGRIVQGKSPYATDQEIYDDIPDLAGTRVALYFPSDRERVRDLILSSFVPLRDPKTFPLPSEELDNAQKLRRARKRFSGYAAEHFRVRLIDTELSTDEKKYSDGRCEIQVASVLMHAWAEVEHDLEYKTLTGSVTRVESALLDQINGLVIAGEMALEQLHQATLARSGQSGAGEQTPFRDQYDLANWLLNVASALIEKKVLSQRPPVGRADLAFRFIELLQLDPDVTLPRLRERLFSLESLEAEKPLAQTLIEALLEEDAAREVALQRAKSELAASESASAPAAASTPTSEVVALGHFLTSWRKLEATARSFASKQGIGERQISLSSLASRLSQLDALDGTRFTGLMQLRNRALHATSDAPSASQLFFAAEQVQQLERRLAERNDVAAQLPTVSANETVRQVLARGGIAIHLSHAFYSPERHAVFVLLAVENTSPVTRVVSDLALVLNGLPILPTKSEDEQVSTGEFPYATPDEKLEVEPQATKRRVLHFAVSLGLQGHTKYATVRATTSDLGTFEFRLEVLPMRALRFSK